MTVAARPSEFQGNERFEVLRRLGAGGMGVVYEAHDRQRDERVALKWLRGASAEAVLRFKREFRALHDLSHPNLVGLGEMFVEQGECFFTMELVHGVDLLTHVRAAPPDLKGSPPPSASALPYDDARLRSSLQQLALGIAALHSAGKVHRDVKPSNVLVTPGGRVVLLDFGLITEATPQRQSTHAGLVGTAAYMSPEQALSSVTPASDWYSLGVVLYEALTERLPHDAPSTLGLMIAKQQPPPPPHVWRHDIAPDLDQLCVALLRTEPEQRPLAPEILSRLGIDAAESGSTATSATSITQHLPFVGRTRDLETLRQAFERSRSQTTIAVIAGQSGVGKTRLAEHFVATLENEHADIIVLSARCYERESVPYKAFDGIADALSRFLVRLPREEARALLPRGAGRLPQLFEVLSRVDAIARASWAPALPDALEQRRRMFAAFRDLLGNLTRRGRLILQIDDIHWTDADSLALIRAVCGPLGEPLPLLLLVTVHAPLEVHRVDVLSTLREAAPTTEIHLEGFREPDSRLLLQALLPEANDALIEAIVRQTLGHPLFIQELARHLAGTRALASVPTLDEALGARIAQLPDEARRLLDVVCIAEGPIVTEAATIAAELEPDARSRAIRLLRAAHLVRSGDIGENETLVVYHMRLRDLVVADLSAAELKDGHERIAIALERVNRGRTQPQLLVHHWTAAGNLTKASLYAEAAGHNALTTLAFDRAADFFLFALRVEGAGSPRWLALKLLLASSLTKAGRCPEAAEVFTDVAGVHPDQATRLDCQRQAAEQWLVSGHIERGLDVMRALLSHIGEPMPTTPRMAVLSVIKNRALLAVRGRKWTERQSSEIARSVSTRLEILRTASHGLSMVDNVRGADFNARYLRLALRTGDKHHVAISAGTEAIFRASQGSRGAIAARRVVEQIHAISASTPDDPYLAAGPMVVDGVIAYFAGQFRHAEGLLARAEAAFAQHTAGTTYERNNSRLFRMFCLRFMGELRRVEELARQYLEDAAQRGDNFADATFRRYCMPICTLARGLPERAREELSQVRWSPSAAAFHLQHWYELEARAEIALYEGSVSEHFDALATGFEALDHSMLPRVRTVRVPANWLRGRLLLARGMSTRAEHRTFARIVRSLRDEDVNYATVPALLLTAASADRYGQRHGLASPAAALEAAIEVATASDMQLHAAAARMRLGELVKGKEGASSCAAALDWFHGQGVVDPRRMVELVAPGFSSG